MLDGFPMQDPLLDAGRLLDLGRAARCRTAATSTALATRVNPNKRLEREKFAGPLRSNETMVTLTGEQLHGLLDGYDVWTSC